MALRSTRQPEISELEVWALAQAVQGKNTSNLPISGSVKTLIQELMLITSEWRGQALSDKAGRDIALKVAQVPANAPMPMKIAPAVTPAAQLTPAPKNHLIRADDLKDLPPPKYALEDYPIYSSCLNALVGPSGGGKSFVAVDIAGRMAIQGATVVYIAGEGLFGYSARWEVWKAARSIQQLSNCVFYDQPVNFMDDSALQQFIDEIAPYNPSLIIVDTVARCMVGGDENSTRDMGVFIASCDRLIHLFNAGVVAIHHTGKDGKMRGSSALYGACDSVLFLQRADQLITVHNGYEQGGKNKYSAEAPPMMLQLIPREAAVDDKVFESAILVKAAEVVRSKSEKLRPNQREILDVLEAYDKGLRAASIEEMTQISRSTMFKVLKDMKKWDWITIEDNEYYKITDLGRRKLYDE